MPALLPSPERLAFSAANAFDLVVRRGVADLRPTPARVVREAPKGTLFEYLPQGRSAGKELPVLLVPPLAAPSSCFDLRRGCSLAEHLLAAGRPTYLVDYGSIGFGDRDLGLEHWVHEVIPQAVQAASDDAGGRPVQLVGWCLGGIMTLLAMAAQPSLPVSAIAAVASPFDFRELRLFATLRSLANLTNGVVGTAVYRALGGAPAPLVKRAFQLSALDKHLTKPVMVMANLHDRDALAQMEAVDAFTDNMHAYPGRTMGQLYHRFFRVNDLADGRLALGDHDIDLAGVRVPVLAIAGRDDTLAPPAAVHHVGALLVNAPEVQLKTAPGGHLGVLAGRSAQRTTWRSIDEFFARHAEASGAVEPAASGPATAGAAA